MTDKELIRALRGTQSRSKRALLNEAAERILWTMQQTSRARNPISIGLSAAVCLMP